MFKKAIGKAKAALATKRMINGMCPACKNRIAQELQRTRNVKATVASALRFVCPKCKTLIEKEIKTVVEAMKDVA